MEPLKMLEEGVKVKSWAMVKAALKELQEKPEPQPVVDTHQELPFVPPSVVSPPPKSQDGIFVVNPNKSNPAKAEAAQSISPAGVVSQPKVNTGNLFYDDGQLYQEDKKYKPNVVVERTRPEYKPVYLNCSICSKRIEVDGLTYSYHKNGAEKGDGPIPYVCQNCL